MGYRVEKEDAGKKYFNMIRHNNSLRSLGPKFDSAQNPPKNSQANHGV